MKQVDIQPLFESAGRTLTHRVVTVGSYDTATGQVTNTTSDDSFTGIFTNYSDKSLGTMRLEIGERFCLMDASTVGTRPKVADFIVDGSDVYSITDCQVVQWGSEVIAYLCRIRK